MSISSVFVAGLGRVIVPIAVFGALALSRKFFKTRPEDAVEAEDASTIIPSVLLVNLGILAAGALILFVCHYALTESNQLFAGRDGHTLMVLYPSPYIWWFFPGFAALTLGWELTLRIWLVSNPKQANAYRAYSNMKSGFDSTKVLRILAVFVTAPIGILSALAVPIHTSLLSTGLRRGQYASLAEAELPYANVSAMIAFDGDQLRDGSFQQRAGILLRSQDGASWNLADNRDPQKYIDPTLLKILTERTNKEPEYSHTAPK